MNAIVNSPRPAARVAPHPTHVLKMLVKREMWESWSQFIRAPLVAGAVFLLFTIIGGGAGQMAFLRHTSGEIEINGQRMQLSQVNWTELLSKASPSDMAQFHDVVNIATVFSGVWPLLVFGVVVFFYLLGSLSDDRRDRSILFWKSLPVSDTAMVLSKLVTALVVAPLLALAAALVVMLGSGLIVTVLLAINHANPFTLYWAQLDPLTILAGLVAWLPGYILWALPTAGWLMLCSAWARNKPLLWAILVPCIAGLLVSWFDLLRIFNLESSWFWNNVVGRLLTSAWPGSNIASTIDAHVGGTPNLHLDLPTVLGIVAPRALYTSPSLWIGAVAGIAMIIAAIRLRRWNVEG